MSIRSLLGFDDDVRLGAGRPSAKGKPAAAKLAPVKTRRAAASTGRSPHKAAIVSAIDAGKRAIDRGRKGEANVKKYEANAKAGKHGPIVPLSAKVAMHGLAPVIVLGAVAAVARKITPKAKAAVNKHTKAIAKHAMATRRLAVASAKAEKAGRASLDFTKKAAPYLKAVLAGKKAPTGVHGDDAEILGELRELEELCGELELLGVGDLTLEELVGLASLMGDDGDAPPDAGDGSVPPDAGAGDLGPDPSLSSSGVVTAPDGTVLYDPSQDPGVVPVPQRGGTLTPDDLSVVWQNAPDDGIVIDEATIPPATVMSYSLAFGTQNKAGGVLDNSNIFTGSGTRQYGFMKGGTRANSNIPGEDEQAWIWVHGKKGDSGSIPDFPGQERGVSGWWDNAATINPSYSSSSAVGQASLGKGYGPLIGTGKFAGMQFAIADGKWFFQGAVAPKWASAEADAKIAQANQKTIAANTAAAQAQAAQMAKDLAAQQEAQAKQDADNALKESAEQSAANVAASQQQTQASQIDVDTQRADLEAAKADAANDAAAQHALIQDAENYNAWAKAHPDEAYSAAQQGRATARDDFDEDGGGDEGDGDEGGEDLEGELEEILGSLAEMAGDDDVEGDGEELEGELEDDDVEGDGEELEGDGEELEGDEDF